METNQFIQFTNRHKLGLLIFAAIFVMLLVLSRYSFVTITVQSPASSGEYTYRITNESGEESIVTSDKPSYRKLVTRGTYSVDVSQGDKNYFAFVSANGFLLNKNVNATLAAEKSRQFVGDNPDICMSYSSTILFSYSCGGTIKTLKAHMPAINSQATFARMIRASGDQLEGMVRVNDKTVALIKTVGGDSSSSPRLITVVNENGSNANDGSFHNELSSSSPYEVKKFRNGFVVLANNSTDLYYYQDTKQQGEKISLTPPKDTKLSRYAWGTSPDSIAVALTNRSKSDVADPHKETTSGTSTVLLYQDGKSREVKIKGYFTDILPCGTKKLCVINGKQLQIYDVSGKPKLLYTLPSVQAISSTDTTLLVATENSILALDVDKKTGAVDYSFGNYTFCGMSADSDGYQLCLINEQQRKVALRVNQTADNTDNIDKKIAELQKSKAVSLVSIYKNTIVVVPNYGPKVYNPANRIYESDPATVTRMNNEFAKDLRASGIDTSKYQISGLGE